MKTALCLVASIFVALNLAAAKPDGGSSEIGDCRVIDAPGTYKVVADLPGKAGLLDFGNCLVVGASFVTVDLADHSITGQGFGGGITDDGVPQTGVSIRNGSISNFSRGIDFGSSEGTTIEHVRALDNLSDGIVSGLYSLLLYNVAIRNGGGVLVQCPSKVIGTSAWDNPGGNIVLIDSSLCTTAADHNSSATSGPNTCPDCPSYLTDCAGRCEDLLSDEANCGSCGYSCLQGELCVSGACSLNCQWGLDICNGRCVNLLADESNCGTCGISCPNGVVCQNGTCQ